MSKIRLSQIRPEGSAGQYPKVNAGGTGWDYDTPTGGAGSDTAWSVVGTSGKPSFQNGWSNYGTTSPWLADSAAYRLATGIVFLRGLITGGTVADGVYAFTLPAGYRPGSRIAFAVLSNGAFGRVDVNTDGGVNIESPSSNAWVSLNGITFIAEA